ncbi:hypothetical protein [Spartinivicinus poritis]|uniref:Uncharacterized protein n=1 Tax=Spartinivicinus poritis TaxID=2994640 RepID=A0ABT5UD26_9GAMM|nr:hypothetical protein [Spartinivicinus sp. A2-2]MDE1464115.1 hypothetical protein [Spartinivicinus sp. A2-2]
MDQYSKIIESNDDAERWEDPVDFNYKVEQQEFLSAKDRLQSALHRKFELCLSYYD